MAASIVVPARSRSNRALGARGTAATAAARTAPRGAGLAPVVPLPIPDVALPPRGPAVAPRPALTLVPPTVRRRSAVGGRLVVLLAAVVLLAVGVATVATGSADRGGPVAAGHVVLQPGESLWDVAVRSAPAGVDPRRQLDTLRRLNGFGPGPLDAWTVVLIPGV